MRFIRKNNYRTVVYLLPPPKAALPPGDAAVWGGDAAGAGGRARTAGLFVREKVSASVRFPENPLHETDGEVRGGLDAAV